MSENRDWVIDQLREILSPRTAKRLKLGKAVRRKMRAGELSDSDSDMEDDYGVVKLSEEAAHLMRTWLTHALARARGRGSNLLMLSDTSESETEAGIQRFQSVTLSEGASAAMTGWLAAVRQLRANRKASLRTAAVFSSTDFSSESDTDNDSKFSAGPMDVSLMSRGIMMDWLTRVREVRGNMPSPTHIHISSDDDSSDFSSSDSLIRGADNRQSNVSHVAHSVMGNWLQTARVEATLNPARTRSDANQQNHQVTSSDSDLETSSSDPDLPFDPMRAQHIALSLASSHILREWVRLAKEKALRPTPTAPPALSESDVSDESPQSLIPE